MPTPTIQDLRRDPDFIGLPIEEQRLALKGFYPEFSDISENEQTKVILSLKPKPLEEEFQQYRQQRLAEAEETLGARIGGRLKEATAPVTGLAKTAAGAVADIGSTLLRPTTVIPTISATALEGAARVPYDIANLARRPGNLLQFNPITQTYETAKAFLPRRTPTEAEIEKGFEREMIEREFAKGREGMVKGTVAQVSPRAAEYLPEAKSRLADVVPFVLPVPGLPKGVAGAASEKIPTIPKISGAIEARLLEKVPPDVALTKAIQPINRLDTRWDSVVKNAPVKILENSETAVTNYESALQASREAANSIGQKIKQVTGRSDILVDTEPIVKNIMEKISTPKMRRESPVEIKAIEDQFSQYKGKISLQEAETILEETNRDLHMPLYERTPSGQIAARSRTAIQAQEELAKGLREQINFAIDEIAGESGAGKQLKRDYGDVATFKGQLQRRYLVEKRKAVDSLMDRYSKTQSAADLAEAAGWIMAGHPGVAAGKFGSAIVRKFVNSKLKDINSADTLIRNAFEKISKNVERPTPKPPPIPSSPSTPPTTPPPAPYAPPSQIPVPPVKSSEQFLTEKIGGGLERSLAQRRRAQMEADLLRKEQERLRASEARRGEIAAEFEAKAQGALRKAKMQREADALKKGTLGEEDAQMATELLRASEAAKEGLPKLQADLNYFQKFTPRNRSAISKAKSDLDIAEGNILSKAEEAQWREALKKGELQREMMQRARKKK